MTTITIEIPDKEAKSLSAFIKKRGGNIISVDDDGFTKDELDSVKQGLKEALMIKNGQLKSIPMSDLWNE